MQRLLTKHCLFMTSLLFSDFCAFQNTETVCTALQITDGCWCNIEKNVWNDRQDF